MQEAKKPMKEKGIKAEDVKNLPPIEEMHGLDTALPPKVVELNSFMKFDDNNNPYNMHPSQCLYEFDNYIRKQDHFNANVMKQLKYHSYMIACLSDLLFRITNDVRGVGKLASMVQTQLEQVAKSQRELLDEMNNNINDHAVRVMTRGGRMTQGPLYPEGRPKRIEQDSQRVNTDVPSHSKKKRKKKNDRTLHTSSEPETEKPPKANNDVSISDAKTQFGNEHSPSDNKNMMMRFM